MDASQSRAPGGAFCRRPRGAGFFELEVRSPFAATPCTGRPVMPRSPRCLMNSLATGLAARRAVRSRSFNDSRDSPLSTDFLLGGATRVMTKNQRKQDIVALLARAYQGLASAPIPVDLSERISRAFWLSRPEEVAGQHGDHPGCSFFTPLAHASARAAGTVQNTDSTVRPRLWMEPGERGARLAGWLEPPVGSPPSLASPPSPSPTSLTTSRDDGSLEEPGGPEPVLRGQDPDARNVR